MTARRLSVPRSRRSVLLLKLLLPLTLLLLGSLVFYLFVIFMIIALLFLMLVIVKLNYDIFFGYYDLRYAPQWRSTEASRAPGSSRRSRRTRGRSCARACATTFSSASSCLRKL